MDRKSLLGTAAPAPRVAAPPTAHQPLGRCLPINAILATSLEQGQSARAIFFEIVTMRRFSLTAPGPRRKKAPHRIGVLALLVLLAGAAFSASAACAHSHKKKGLEIVHPWTHAMVDKSATVLVSMTIKNRSGAADRLLRASTPLATAVEIREPGRANALPGVAIGSGRTIELNRNGPHLHLKGCKTQLDPYESFAMMLVFEKAGTVLIEVMVEEGEAEPQAH